MEKRVLERRLALMDKAGVVFRPNADIGRSVRSADLQREFDATVLACGAGAPRDLTVPGRELSGIHFAMEYLTLSNRRCEGDRIDDERFISAEGKRVVIIGGGDTGADCLGTVHRQRAASVHQFELLPRPPDTRAADNPWPQWPNVFRVSGAHEEGGERVYAVSTQRFTGTGGRLEKLHGVNIEMIREGGRLDFKPIAGTEFTLDVDLVLLAMGFLGPERTGPIEELGLKLTERGNVARDPNWMTSAPGVFTCGDMQRGQSLIVWAIAEGRSCAAGVDRWLMGRTDLPSPCNSQPARLSKPEPASRSRLDIGSVLPPLGQERTIASREPLATAAAADNRSLESNIDRRIALCPPAALTRANRPPQTNSLRASGMGAISWPPSTIDPAVRLRASTLLITLDRTRVAFGAGLASPRIWSRAFQQASQLG
jgi:thioredoxin reductase